MTGSSTDSRLALARLRAAGMATPGIGINGPAARAGRAVVRATARGDVVDVLAWPAGFEPGEQEGHAAGVAPFVTLVFAACLGACWLDRAAHPWPGVPSSEDEITDAVALARTDHPDQGFIGRVRGALSSLRTSLLIDPDPDESAISLGPRVASWPDGEVELLRGVYDRLPRSPAAGRSGDPAN